jgi:hypothetical protein
VRTAMKKNESQKQQSIWEDTEIAGNGNSPVDTSKANGFLVVGIGASAGGIQALKQFFENVRPNSGIAYVVILHLSPDHESKLAEILQIASRIPVTQVNEAVAVKPDQVYVVPPNKSMTMSDGHINILPLSTIEERRAPVDIFIRTLADSHGPRSVAVVLSGTGANGSMGLKRVKEFGGAAFVQNPGEAEFDEMPRNAIATDLIDAVLPVAQIPERIVAYDEKLEQIRIPVEVTERQDEQQHALRDIFTQLRVRTGHDFSNYKRATVLRRISSRRSWPRRKKAMRSGSGQSVVQPVRRLTRSQCSSPRVRPSTWTRPPSRSLRRTSINKPLLSHATGYIP